MKKDSFLEYLLGSKKNEGVSNNDNKNDFDLKTNFDNQIKLDANDIYKKFCIFKPKSIESTSIEPVIKSRQDKRLKIDEQANDTGEKWYNIQKQTLTPEMKADLEILKVGGLIDPKIYKKKPDWAKLPQYFQIGTIIEGGDEFKTARIPKGKRKANLIDQFLEEDATINYTKKKFTDIQAHKANKTKKKSDRFRKLKKKGIIRG